MPILANTFSVLFNLRIRRLTDEKSPIYARITINKKRIELSSQEMMNASDWDEKEGLAKPITREYMQVNTHLEQLKNSCYNIYRDMILKKGEISAETFRMEELPYCQQAQAYFGHYILKGSEDRRKRIHFFVMMLSLSRMKL